MHVTEREQTILELIERRGFIAFRELENQLDASPTTLRRDLVRMAHEGRINRVRGGAGRASEKDGPPAVPTRLKGEPFQKEKEAIGRVAAGLCEPGSAIMIDGGSTTLQMCRHFTGKHMQVLTNSLHIASALLPLPDTRVLVPGGSVFREQGIILTAAGDDAIPRIYTPKLFMGAAGVGARGVMQVDVVLVAAERRLIERAEELILLVDSSKFQGSGNIVCDLAAVDIVVTDQGITKRDMAMLKAAGIQVIVAAT